MKKKSLLIVLCLVFLLSVLGVCACGVSKPDGEQGMQQEQSYKMYVDYVQGLGQTPLSYEEWLKIANNGNVGTESGEQGSGVEIVWIDESGHLKIKYYGSSEEIDLGKVNGARVYSKGMKYVLNQEQTGYILTEIGDCVDENVLIPPTYRNKPVLEIGSQAFHSSNTLKNVSIPENVTKIGESAFAYCKNLNSIIFESNDKLTDIEYGAFTWCTTLSDVKLPDSVVNIGDNILYNCFRLKFKVENAINYVGSTNNPYFFAHSRTMEFSGTVNLNKNCKYIGDELFINCQELESVQIPANIIGICSFAFSWCDNLKEVTFEQNSNLKHIGRHAFNACCEIKSLALPSSLTKIGVGAFAGCNQLESVRILDNVTVIEEMAFQACAKLKELTFGKNSKLESIKDMAFNNCQSLERVVFPVSIREIGKSAFFNNENLKEVEFLDYSNWYVTKHFEDWVSKSGGESIDLEDKTFNVNYFKLLDNCDKYFYKV